MDLHSVLSKTEKGEEEIATRKFGLQPGLRYVLILVDGSSSVARILEKGAGLSDIVKSLEALDREGFIAVDEGKGASGVKDALVAVAEELLGSNAGKVVQKIQSAPDTPEGIEAALQSCKKLVKLIIDERKAEELMSRCREIIAHR